MESAVATPRLQLSQEKRPGTLAERKSLIIVRVSTDRVRPCGFGPLSVSPGRTRLHALAISFPPQRRLIVRARRFKWRGRELGVSAMGFGGINAHVVLESLVNRRHTTINAVEHGRTRSAGRTASDHLCIEKINLPLKSGNACGIGYDG
jgi:hypothetical protein